jgi:hypothetical protein
MEYVYYIQSNDVYYKAFISTKEKFTKNSLGKEEKERKRRNKRR